MRPTLRAGLEHQRTATPAPCRGCRSTPRPRGHGPGRLPRCSMERTPRTPHPMPPAPYQSARISSGSLAALTFQRRPCAGRFDHVPESGSCSIRPGNMNQSCERLPRQPLPQRRPPALCASARSWRCSWRRFRGRSMMTVGGLVRVKAEQLSNSTVGTRNLSTKPNSRDFPTTAAANALDREMPRTVAVWSMLIVGFFRGSSSTICRCVMRSASWGPHASS